VEARHPRKPEKTRNSKRPGSRSPQRSVLQSSVGCVNFKLLATRFVQREEKRRFGIGIKPAQHAQHAE